jgi:hypothetical protein
VRETAEEARSFFPLLPLIPKWALKRIAAALLGFDGQPVSCSNMGDLSPDVARPDGTDAEYVYLRGVNQQMTRREH